MENTHTIKILVTLFIIITLFCLFILFPCWALYPNNNFIEEDLNNYVRLNDSLSSAPPDTDEPDTTAQPV